jgi:tellurite resistance-related uncharacterized protein
MPAIKKSKQIKRPTHQPIFNPSKVYKIALATSQKQIKLRYFWL